MIKELSMKHQGFSDIANMMLELLDKKITE